MEVWGFGSVAIGVVEVARLFASSGGEIKFKKNQNCLLISTRKFCLSHIQMHKEPWICLYLKSDSADLPAETRLILSYLEYILFFHFSLQAVSVGKHVKGYHYIIANLVRRFVICFVFWGMCLLCSIRQLNKSAIQGG